MKKLTCEMCNSTDLVKEDGVFVCQYCGTKYSVEDARKMMSGDKVEITGTVKVEKNTEGLKKLADESYEQSDYETAAKYYTQIVEDSPQDYESNYRRLVCLGYLGTAVDIKFSRACTGFAEYIKYLYADETLDEEERNARVISAVDVLSNMGAAYYGFKDKFFTTRRNAGNLSDIICTNEDNYNAYLNLAFAVVDGWIVVIKSLSEYIESSEQFKQGYRSLCSNVEFVLNDIASNYGKVANLIYTLPDVYLTDIGKQMIYDRSKILLPLYQKVIPDKRLPSRMLPTSEGGTGVSETRQSEWCYIATCVYGSYDCPNVWVLRRYRDEVLGRSMAGRLFIRSYYAISPHLVSWFGDTALFQRTFRTILNKLVAGLQERGLDNTPYQDQNWRKR